MHVFLCVLACVCVHTWVFTVIPFWALTCFFKVCYASIFVRNSLKHFSWQGDKNCALSLKIRTYICVSVVVSPVSSQIPAKCTAGCSNSYFQPIVCKTKFSKKHIQPNTHTYTCTHTHTHTLTSSVSRKHIQITGNKLTQIPHRRYIRCYRCCCFCCCCWVCEFSASASLPKSTHTHTHTECQLW